MTAGAGDRGMRVGDLGDAGVVGVEDVAYGDSPVASKSGGRPPQEGSSELWTEGDSASGEAPARAGSDKRLAADVGSDGGDVDSDVGSAELVPAASRTGFQSRWNEVQTMFVDEPRVAVDRADALVAEVVQAVTSGFADRKVALEQRWSSGGDVATEDLRQVLRSYRAFFERLLKI